MPDKGVIHITAQVIAQAAAAKVSENVSNPVAKAAVHLITFTLTAWAVESLA